MISARAIRKKALEARPADYSQRRGDNTLLIWADIPYWIVADSDLALLLAGLDGRRTLRAVLTERPEWRSAEREVTACLRQLLEVGVVQDAEARHDGNNAPSDDLPPIENVAVNLTRQCNLRCRFCYNLDRLVTTGDTELTASEITSAIDGAKGFLAKKPSLTILGGEPLLHEDKLLDLARYGRRNGLNTLVSTNGTLITEAFAHQAQEVGLQVQISLDGHNAELHDSGRGAGTFDKVSRGIDLLARSGTYTILSMVCHSGNFAHLQAFYEFALSHGVDEARFIPLKLMGGAPDSGVKPVPMKSMMRKAFDIFCRNPEFATLTGRDAFSIMANGCRYSARRRSCGTGLRTFLIDSDGSIYPCLNTNLPEFEIANVRDPGFNFEHTWRESPVLRMVREESTIDEANPTCSQCAVRYWCLGGCRGETHVKTGAFNGTAWNCGDLKQTVIEMLWLLAERPDLVKPIDLSC